MPRRRGSLEWRVRRARTRLSPAEIVGATIDAVPYIGFPRALNTISTAKPVFEDRNPPPSGWPGPDSAPAVPPSSAEHPGMPTGSNRDANRLGVGTALVGINHVASSVMCWLRIDGASIEHIDGRRRLPRIRRRYSRVTPRRPF
jgi:hypothetical protein